MRRFGWALSFAIGLFGCSEPTVELAGCGDECQEPSKPTDPTKPGKPADPGPKDMVCAPRISFETTVFGQEDPIRDLRAFAPKVASGEVLFEAAGTISSNSPDDAEIVAYSPLTQAQRQLTRNDVDDELIDARDGAMLVLRTGEVAQLLYVDEDGEVVLEEQPSTWRPLLEEIRFDGSQARYVERKRVAFEVDGEILFFDGIRARSVSSGLTNPSGPYLHGNLVTFSASDGHDSEVYLAGPDGTLRLSDDETEDVRPVISWSDVFWISDGALEAHYASGSSETLHPGPCSPPVAYEQLVLSSCKNEAGEWELTMFREKPKVLARLLQPPQVAALDAHGVAYLEYDEGEPCTGGGSGALRYLDFETGESAELARVGVPCLCCDAFWPPPALSLVEDVVAWNYAEPNESQGPFGSPARFGVALVRRERVCAPK
ncbi:MAG: hypothetical protein HY791_18995 [Deltaproteobacteria bacterium]|nr:hypothetical protein [Deltaproteobacteria bacterium]